MKLGIDDDQLASCVQCGLCLPHCPTWRVTGEEQRSPRGRIEAMRQVQWHDEPIDAGFVESMDSCVQCRGCEPACPSGVPFGKMMEATRDAMVREVGYQPWWRRVAYRALGHHRLLLVGATGVAVAQRVNLVPRRLAPRLSIRRSPLEPVRSDGQRVWFVTGCVMDAVQRHVHDAAIRVLGMAGFDVRLASPHEGCCGALAAHAGLTGIAAQQTDRLLSSYPGRDPIVVDAAGCGAHLKAHSDRVVDVSELLSGRVDALPPATGPRVRVAIQDACHLRHVQKVHGSVRTLLAPFADIVELDDDGLCCGAGGAYSMLRPVDAAEIRDRKLAAIRRSGAKVVVSANPGCAIHLAAAGVDVRHPVEMVADAIRNPRAV